ncbi:hypothetical protein ACHQM5_003622 [Ranunculus cassubicifolius]
MLHIFLKLGVIDLLLNAQSVCSSWRKLAKEPQLYRRIDVNRIWSHPKKRLTIEAIDRSCGQLLDFSLIYVTKLDVLQHIANTSNSLRALRLTCSSTSIPDDLLIEVLEKFPLLEELDLSFCPFSERVIEAAGLSCPQLKSFRLHAAFRYRLTLAEEINKEALAIATNMPGLRRLHLSGNKMNENGLKVILEKCPHLEYLDLRQCFHIIINEDLRVKLGGIKEIRLPTDF